MSSKKLTKSDLKEINGASASAKTSEEDFAEFQEKKTKKGRGAKKKHYVDAEVFKSQIMQYYIDENMTDELGKSISDIANRLGFAGNFINYTYKEEMIGY